MNGRARRQSGVTVVELAITTLLVAILMATAVPTMRNWLLNVRIRTAAEAAKDGMNLARAEAVRRNAAVEFVLGAGAAWTVRVARTGDTIQTHPAGEGTADVTLVATPGGAVTVTFDGLGRRAGANADGSDVLTRLEVDLPATVLAADETRDLRLDVGLGGQVRMCDPNVSDAADSRHCE